MAEKSNSKKRTLLATLIAVALVGGGAYYFATNSGSADKEEVADLTSAVNVDTSDNNIKVIPGQSDDPEYNEKQKEVNKQNYEEALKNDESFVPKLVNNEAKEEVIEQPKEEAPIEEQKPAPVVEQPVVQQPVQQFEQPVVQQPIVQQEQKPQYDIQMPAQQAKQTEEVDSELEMAYTEELRKIQEKMSSTDNKDAMATEFEYLGKAKEKEQASNSSASDDQSATAQDSKAGKSSGPTFVRSGTIVPAHLITAINTDEPGPVLAEISTGPLKGARLIGEVVNAPTDVTSNVQKATIQFTSLQIPGDNHGAYSISAFAVDPNTSRTAVASSVDNHYFRRYGLGMAAAFIEGIGEAFGKSGTTVTYTDQATIQSMSNDTKTVTRSALGNVGKKFGRELDKIADVPATIQVKAGYPIGLLFMSDF